MKIKKWFISVLNDKPYRQVKDVDFFNQDDEAHLIFKLLDSFKPSEMTVLLFNKDDDSLINESVQIQNKEYSYHLRNEIIKHSGNWIVQLVFIHEGKRYVSQALEFTVKGDIMDGKEPSLEIIEDWENFLKNAEAIKTELANKTDEASQLISRLDNAEVRLNQLMNQAEGFVNNENQRKQNEQQRKQNESERQLNEDERQNNETQRQSNEDTRQQQESLRESKSASREQSYQQAEDSRDSLYQEAEADRDSSYQQAEADRTNTLLPRIQTVENDLQTLENTLIESGSNNNGDWLKFKDGTMISWHGSNTKEIPINTAWGSLFYSDYIDWDYPQAFISSPRVFVEFNKFEGDAWVMRGGNPKVKTNSGQFYLIRPTSDTVKGNLDFMAIGKWK